MPIDKRELGNRRVARLIEDCRNRANVVGYLARPRARRVEKEVGYAGARIRTLLKPEHSKESSIFEPQWGAISHPGWSSPAARETPNLEYNTVVNELTDLIEARAVSLAPVDPSTGPNDGGNAAVDEYIIEALRRPEEQGMRAYITQLISLDVLADNSLLVAFLTLYERARFAPNPLNEHEFKQLMRMFAEILRTMKTLDINRLDHPDDSDEPPALHHEPNTIENLSRPSQIARDPGAQASSSSLATSTSSPTSSSIAGSVRRYAPTHARPRPQLRNTNTNTNATSYITAPPRISHDSVRSISSTEEYQDGADPDPDSDPDPSWTHPTTRPPFFRARSSQHSHSQTNTSTHSRGGRTAHPRPRPRSRATGPRRRSQLRRAMSFASVGSAGESLRSMSVKSNGSVIRLNPGYDGSREMLPFEYIVQGAGSDDGGEGSVRRQVV